MVLMLPSKGFLSKPIKKRSMLEGAVAIRFLTQLIKIFRIQFPKLRKSAGIQEPSPNECLCCGVGSRMETFFVLCTLYKNQINRRQTAILNFYGYCWDLLVGFAFYPLVKDHATVQVQRWAQLIINNSKFVRKNMIYWTYIYTPTILQQPHILPMALTNTTIPDSCAQEAEKRRSTAETSSSPAQILNLDAQDLLRAGYDHSKTPWTEEEDQKLKHLRNVRKMDWSELALEMNGRNSKMCYSRYRRLENNTKESWKRKDDALLIQLVEKHPEDWKEISKNFPSRTLKQVKQHYMNYLKPQIKKDEWTLQEDLKLIELINLYGKNWKKIENFFDGRTQNQIKNRYFGRLKRLAEKKALGKEKGLTHIKKRQEN